MANTCPVCGGKLGLLNREKSADGLICASCSNFFYSKLGFRAAKQSTAALADYWATLEQRRKVFKETDSIYDGDALFVSIDKTNRLFCFAATAKTETRKGSRSKENVSIRFTLPLGEISLPTTVYPGGMTAFLKRCKVSQEKPQVAALAASSAADELLKFKQLLDMGAITEAEYNAKKAQLLGL